MLRRRGRAAILLHHRIASPPRDPWGMAVSREAFERQLALLASEYRPMALRELLAAGRTRAVLDAGPPRRTPSSSSCSSS